jgi:hypothetical protein
MAVDADPGTTFPTPATARPSPGEPTAAATAVVLALVAVPAATYAAAVDERSGALLAETGAAGSGAALTTLLTWAQRATALRGPDGLDDLVVTTDRAFHVLRRTAVSGVPVWTYLRVDRQGGNLALARRAVRTAGAARPGPPAPRPTGVPSGGTPSDRIGTALPKRPPAALPAPGGARSPLAPRAAATAVRPVLPDPASGWSADTATLRRLLAGLRRLA